MALRSFAELPALVEGLLARGEHERVVLVYFDAFGWRFAERHGEHRLLQEAEVERWASQFPSTTAVHTTTIHTGLPVGEHGIYEWNVYEPTLDRLITPLWHSFAGDSERETLRRVGIEGADLFPFEPLYARWEWPSHAAFPAAYAFSPATRSLAASATVHPFRDSAEGLELLARALTEEERGYGTIHLPDLDTHMHLAGPDDPHVDTIVAATLDAIRAAPWPSGTLVLVTSDHGMAAISPERTSYVNVVWPELPDHLAHGADGKALAPAGSARDLFLHVLPERLDEVAARLGDLLAEKADVRRVDELVAEGLFGAVGERLRARLANLVVLPRAGEAAYWLEPGRFEQRFLGQHGGLSPDEAEIPLVRWLAP